MLFFLHRQNGTDKFEVQKRIEGYTSPLIVDGESVQKTKQISREGRKKLSIVIFKQRKKSQCCKKDKENQK